MEEVYGLIIVGALLIVLSNSFFKEYDELNKRFDEKQPIRSNRFLSTLILHGLTFIFIALLGRKGARIAFIILGVLLILLAVSRSGWI